MFGALLGGAASVIGAMMQAKAQQEQNYINEMALNEQKRNAAEQMKRADAEQSDIYGNKVKYNPYLNKYETTLTPDQQAIINAQQAEQKYSLTEGARRRHEQERYQAERGKAARPIYDKLLADYQFNPPKSEGAYQDEAVTDELLAGQDRAKGAGNQLARLAVRGGQDPTALTGIMKAVADQIGGGIAGGIQKGKAQGRQVFGAETQLHDAKLKPLEFFAEMADKQLPNSLMLSDRPDAIAKLIGESRTSAGGALANEANQLGSAYGALARSAGLSPDLSGVASALSGMPDPSGGGGGNVWAPAATSTGGSGGIFDDPYSLGSRTTGGVNYTDPSIIQMYQMQHS